MNLDIIWFELSHERDDIQNVIKFLNELSDKLRMFVSEENSNFFQQLTIADNPYITKSGFLNSLNEARVVLVANLAHESELAYNPEPRSLLYSRLRNVGFTNDSLRIKGETLNFHWKKVIRKLDKLGSPIIDFANNELVKLVRRFLIYLNSILGSLTKVFPGAEVVKEIKEIIESYLGMADE